MKLNAQGVTENIPEYAAVARTAVQVALVMESILKMQKT